MMHRQVSRTIITVAVLGLSLYGLAAAAGDASMTADTFADMLASHAAPEPPIPSPNAVYLPLLVGPPPVRGAVSGRVFGSDGPISGATVRIQATNIETLTGPDGQFKLDGLGAGVPVTVSAWKHGHYCAKVEGVIPPASGVSLLLHRYQASDNPDYEWIPPVAPAGGESCARCKPGVTQVWLENDAHAAAATNERFLTMYNGTDVDGNQSPRTRYRCIRDYGCFPLPPDPSQPYYGPGYKLDFPLTAGDCAACHTPGAAVDAPYGTDPNAVTGADEFGVHCDFCHKAADVRLQPADDMPFRNMPGVLSMDIRRPFPEDPLRYQLFFGTFDDDNVPEEDTYLPLIEESRYCAPCHFAIFWDTTVYNSYGEWLDSPYSEPSFPGAMTCQECHMPSPTLLVGEPITNVAPNRGGVERDPLTIHAHTFPGASSVELLQNSVTLTATARLDGGHVYVRVDITNDKTGHHVPTDSPLRQLILLVRAVDEFGTSLDFLGGPTVPDWGGAGDPDDGYYAGVPGSGYAKILEELWTQVSPTGAYWNPTRTLNDDRLAAFETASTDYVFAAPDEGGSLVEVVLLFRRAFIELMDQKGWDVPDIEMERAQITLPASP